MTAESAPDKFVIRPARVFVKLDTSAENYQTQLDIERAEEQKEAARLAAEAEYQRIRSLQPTQPESRESAAHRQRENRKANQAWKAEKEERRRNNGLSPYQVRRDRERRDRGWACRMAERLVRNEPIRLIHLKHEFWLGAMAGFWFDAVEMCRNIEGKACEPLESRMWAWWCDLNWKQRLLLIREHRLKRSPLESLSRHRKSLLTFGLQRQWLSAPSFIDESAPEKSARVD